MEEDLEEKVLNVRNVSLGKCINNTLILTAKPVPGFISKLVVILDVSPSMDGWKLYTAKRLGESIIRLADTLKVDRVEVYSFCKSIKRLAIGPPRAVIEALKSAKSCIGTNLAEALKTAYSQGREVGAVIITDGRPSVGPKSIEAILNVILKEAGQASIPKDKVAIALLGDDSNQELAEKTVERLGGFVYKVGEFNTWDIASIALYTGLASVVPRRVALGLPAWADIEVYGDLPYNKMSDGWVEFDILDAAITSRTIAIAVKSNLSECGEDIVLPIISTVLRVSYGKIVEEKVRHRFVEVKFKRIFLKVERPD